MNIYNSDILAKLCFFYTEQSLMMGLIFRDHVCFDSCTVWKLGSEDNSLLISTWKI